MGKGKASKKVNPSNINHPKSRKAKQFIKQKAKEDKRNKKKITSFIKLNNFGEKIKWFKENLNQDTEVYTPTLASALVEKYLNRYEEERNFFESRKSYEINKYASRRDLVNHTIEAERNEYNTCGIEIPDLFNKEHLEQLKNWNGELRFIQNINFIRLNSNKKLQQTEFKSNIV